MQPTSPDPAGAALATTTNPAGGTATPAAAVPTAAPVAPAATPLTIPAYNYSNNVSSGQALQDLTDFTTHQQSPVDVYNNAVSTLGIPDVRTNVTSLRKQIADTTALLNALPESVTGRTSGSLTTEAQRQRILATERAPLDQANQQYSTNYNMESQNLNDLLGQANTQTGLVTQGQDRISQALQTRYTGIQSAEAEKQRQAEAQRQFDLTVQQIHQDQANFEKNFAASQAQFAEDQRQFNVTNARLSQPSGAAADNKNLLSDLAGISQQYQTNLGKNPSGFREEMIRQLTSRYGASVDPKQIAALVYNTYIPNSLENKNQTAAKNANTKALMANFPAYGGF